MSFIAIHCEAHRERGRTHHRMPSTQSHSVALSRTQPHSAALSSTPPHSAALRRTPHLWKCAKYAFPLKRTACRSPSESLPEKASPMAMKREMPLTASRNWSTVSLFIGAFPMSIATRRCIKSHTVPRACPTALRNCPSRFTRSVRRATLACTSSAMSGNEWQ